MEKQIVEALETAKRILMERMGGDRDKEVPLRDLDRVGEEMEKTPGQELAGTALRLQVLEMGVRANAVDAEQALRIVTNAEVSFRDIQEQGAAGDPANLEPLIRLHKDSRRRIEAAVKRRKA